MSKFKEISTTGEGGGGGGLFMGPGIDGPPAS